MVFEELPEALSKGLPSQQSLGAVLLARLAIDGPYQHTSGRRLGKMLLADVVRTVIAGDMHVATPLLVVDALNETVAGFYRRYGFVPFPDRPLRLGARLRDIRRTFDLD